MAQFARPDSDVNDGNWTDPNGNNNGDLFDDIDETVADDNDYIESEQDPVADVCEVGLSSVTDPVGNVNHVVRYRYQKNEQGGGQPGDIDIIVSLYDGANLIHAETHLDVSMGWAAGTFTLTGGEADNINDYTDLRLRFSADKSAGVRTSWGEISWAEFEVPDVAGDFIPRVMIID
jgi:hypothetical protein